MPKPGQMTEECTIVAWYKQPGDPVARGDILLEIETDKSNMDVEAFEEGVLLKAYFDEGDTVPVNSVIAYIGEEGEEVPDETPAAMVAVTPESSESTTDLPRAEEDRSAAADTPVAATIQRPARPNRLPISPRASRLAASEGIDPRTITGTGPGGRITERDVKAALATVAAAAPAAPPRPAPVAASAPSVTIDESEDGPQTMSRMRQVIAERLTHSATTVPHFNVTVSVDMTGLLALRAELKAAGAQLSVTDFILSATAQTLAEFPEVNSLTDGTSVWVRKRVHLGLAVSVPNGLVVPVIRDADRLSLAEIHDRAGALAVAAREARLSPDDMTGSSFTVSNLGMFGVDEFTAIINPGESAILAVSSVAPTPWVIGDGLAIRQIMKLTLSADHRIIDGELGARFLNALRRRLTDAESFRLDALNS
jgi:pyruvate dehydrogenase E2 component (dihydrolipoamide acetyltransferase)